MAKLALTVARLSQDIPPSLLANDELELINIPCKLSEKVTFEGFIGQRGLRDHWALAASGMKDGNMTETMSPIKRMSRLTKI